MTLNRQDDTRPGLWDARLHPMLKRPVVVVPVDASPGGETTIAYAVALAKRRGAAVDLLHVVRPRGPSVFDSPDLALVGQTSSPHGRIDHLPDSPRSDALTSTADHDDVPVRHVTHKGEPSRAVAAYAQLAMAAVIVIGRYYGSSRWRNSAAVASRLSRATPVPVLIVPPQDPADGCLRTGPFINIVSAIDFTVSSAVALRTALDLARTSGGRVTMVHVHIPPSRAIPLQARSAHADRRSRERGELVLGRCATLRLCREECGQIRLIPGGEHVCLT